MNLTRWSALAAAGALVMAAASGTAVAAAGAAARRATPLPAQVYAPYFETYQPGSITAIAQQSGVKYYTLAFLQSKKHSPCTIFWDGDGKTPVSGGKYLTQIKALRAGGGDVILSFGGYSADSGGTELADSCGKVPAILRDYEQLVLTYGVSRLDFDIESRSLRNTIGIDRRNTAITELEAWATAHGRPLQVSFTMPATAAGLTPSGLAVLANAIAHGTRVDVVNIMTFDYYNGTTDMGKAAITAGEALHAQLAKLYPSKTSAQLYAMEGLTLMPGIDDNPDKAEVTTLSDTRQITAWASAHHIDTLSIWAIQRDNGGCPGTNGSDSCSGVKQATWAFSRILQRFDN
jgi:hypothetical protein